MLRQREELVLPFWVWLVSIHMMSSSLTYHDSLWLKHALLCAWHAFFLHLWIGSWTNSMDTYMPLASHLITPAYTPRSKGPGPWGRPIISFPKACCTVINNGYPRKRHTWECATNALWDGKGMHVVFARPGMRHKFPSPHSYSALHRKFNKRITHNERNKGNINSKKEHQITIVCEWNDSMNRKTWGSWER